MDLLVIETGNGGDIVLNGNDLVTINGFENMPYIGMFGGNVEQSTTQNQTIIAGEQQFDWWGNSLLMFNNPIIQYNSTLERILKTISITSSARETIKRAVMEDLRFFQSIGRLTVDVSITGIDRIHILIRIQQPNNVTLNEFLYIWNSTNEELSMPEIQGIENGNGVALNDIINFEL